MSVLRNLSVVGLSIVPHNFDVMIEREISSEQSRTSWFFFPVCVELKSIFAITMGSTLFYFCWMMIQRIA